MRLVDDHSEGIGLSSKCQGYTQYKLFPFHYNLPKRSPECMHLYFDINVSGPMICNPLIFPNQKLGQIFP